MNNLTKTEKQIQMSVAFNNASRIMAGMAANPGPNADIKVIAGSVDMLARLLYAKQIKFWEEISKEDEQPKPKNETNKPL